MTRVVLLLAVFVLVATAARADTIDADPSDYLAKVDALAPGDTLRLAGGDYTDLLEISGLHGTSGAWITIQGPASGTPARFRGASSICCNTVEIRSGSYLALENLLIDGEGIDGIFGISAAGSNTHHIRVEGCTIVGHGAHQQTVGISTKSTTWGWIIRGNTIVGAGTGIYLGNSNGGAPFIGGIIENNLFLDSKGYNMQIKHQTSRNATIPGIPTTPQVTVIRNNMFLKTNTLVAEDGARPNLLVGDYPASGLGSSDTYEIYGNFFYHNDTESLMQAEGRLSIHDNVFADCLGDAIYLTDHNGELREAYVYNNTFYAVDRAIVFASSAPDGDLAVGNLIFARVGVTGSVTNASNNIVDTVANAATYVNAPSLVLGAMDFYPLPGQCEGPALDLSVVSGNVDYDRDFNGDSKGGFTFRGAYAGSGANPGWQLDAAIKGQSGGGGGGDVTPPTGTVQVDGGAASTSDLLVDLDLTAVDGGSGMGPGAQMRFSNNGTTWSPPEPFATARPAWDLSTYGGSSADGSKVVYASFRDAAGNWSTSVQDSIQYAGGAEPGGSGAAGLEVLLAAILLLLGRRAAR